MYLQQFNNLPVLYRVLSLVMVSAFILALDAAFFNSALAQSADQVFSKGEQKGNELANLLKGKLAVTICGLAIGVTAVLMFMGRVSHMIGIRIIAGAFILGSCVEIAGWLMA